MLFCMTGVLLFVVTTLVVRPMQFPSVAAAVPAATAAAAAAMPTTVAVTASINACHAPASMAGSAAADTAAGDKYFLHQAAAAAASDPPSLASATATLQVDCGFSLSGDRTTPTAAAAAQTIPSGRFSKLMQQVQQQPQGLQQQLQVVGVDVITCAMHAKYPELHQQQRYMFLLHPPELTAGERHIVAVGS
jgi:hypothetical protein